MIFKKEQKMVKIARHEDSWIVTLNGVLYTSCGTIQDAEMEAKTLRRNLRYGNT